MLIAKQFSLSDTKRPTSSKVNYFPLSTWMADLETNYITSKNIPSNPTAEKAFSTGLQLNYKFYHLYKNVALLDQSLEAYSAYIWLFVADISPILFWLSRFELLFGFMDVLVCDCGRCIYQWKSNTDSPKFKDYGRFMLMWCQVRFYIIAIWVLPCFPIKPQ